MEIALDRLRVGVRKDPVPAPLAKAHSTHPGPKALDQRPAAAPRILPRTAGDGSILQAMVENPPEKQTMKRAMIRMPEPRYLERSFRK
jgi:hypothetical protein